MNTCLQSLVIAAMASSLTIASPAQEPNVLPLAATFHVGNYSTEIEPLTGTLRLYGGFGSMVMSPTGTFAGNLAAFETDPVQGTVAIPSDPFGGTYSVRGDGICVLDLDVANPGTDLAPLWITPEGSVMHGVTSAAEPNAASVIAIEAGSGLSNATLQGTYQIVAQRIEFASGAGGGWEIQHQYGTAVLDGMGAGTFTGFEYVDSGAGGAPVPVSAAFPYAVASDGALSIGGDSGACSADGELLFLMTAQASGRVGLLLGVRTGSGYDLQDLAGRYGFTTHGYELGAPSATLPRSRTLFGDLELAATSPVAGSWNFAGTEVETFPSGQNVASWSGSGAATLTAGGELSLANGGSSWQLSVSASGRFVVGREPGAQLDMVFGSRQCARSQPVGAGTSGAGGVVPSLGMRTFPGLGNASFAFAVEDGVGGALCATLVATASGPGLPVFGGTLVLDPNAIGLTIPFVMGGTPGAAGEGSGLAAFAVPGDPSLAGFELWAQALVFDAAALGGVALSNGYRAVLCGG